MDKRVPRIITPEEVDNWLNNSYENPLKLYIPRFSNLHPDYDLFDCPSVNADGTPMNKPIKLSREELDLIFPDDAFLFSGGLTLKQMKENASKRSLQNNPCDTVDKPNQT